MKKVIYLFVLCMVLGLAGCGQSQENKEPSTESTSVQVENKKIEIELNTEDTEKMWTCLSLEDDPFPQKEKEKLIQEKFDDDFNKPEYNIWHKQDRHKDKFIDKEDEEPIYNKAKNKKALFWAGANNPVRSVMHPGIKAQPVVKPTLEAAMPQIRSDVRRVLSAARGGTT